MRVVAINSPWVKNRLKGAEAFWGIPFVFDDYVDVTVDIVPHQAMPGTTGLACLDMEFVQKYKKGFTVFVAPYSIQAHYATGNTISGRALVSGLYMPPLSSLQRWEWFWTRLFWDSPVIEVFANENDHVYVQGKDMGGAFEMWLNHELSHWLYQTVTQLVDKTHEYFYAGTPEKARDEITKILNAKPVPPTPTPAPTPVPPADKITTPRKQMLSVAKSFIGKDASPLDNVPDEVGCADSVSRIIRAVYPEFPVITGTAQLRQTLLQSRRFKGTLALDPGNIIVSPTDSGNGTIRGHTGVIGENGTIMSNDSSTGLWQSNYTIKTWVDRYRGKGGLRIYVFEPVA